MRSLTAKLVIAFVAVTLVAVAILGFMVNRATTAEFGQYLEYGGPEIERIKNGLATYYQRNGDWSNAQLVIRVFSGIQGDRMVLTDGNGIVLADSSSQLIGREIKEDGLGLAVPVRVNNRLVGILHVLPEASQRGPMGGTYGGMMGRMVTGLVTEIAGGAEKSFLGAVNDSLMWAAITAGAVALGLSLFLARQIVSPLRSVTLAARRIASGELSQRVKVESDDEIGQLADAFNTMADNLTRNEQLRRNLVADIAHELRTPLSVIQGKLEAMLDGVVEANPEQIASVHEETLLLNRLVSDLRELSLADAGQLNLHRSPTDVNELLQKTVSRFEQPARERQIGIVAEAAGDLPTVPVDYDRTTQAISNLLSNAIRYSPAAGSILVKAEVAVGRAHVTRTKPQSNEDNVKMPSGRRGGTPEPMLIISVSDQGTGISSEDLPHVFDRFYRVDRSRARASGGSGLGLAIVKEIAEAHGGSAWAESEPGKGSTFSFSLSLNDFKKTEIPS